MRLQRQLCRQNNITFLFAAQGAFYNSIYMERPEQLSRPYLVAHEPDVLATPAETHQKPPLDRLLLQCFADEYALRLNRTPWVYAHLLGQLTLASHTATAARLKEHGDDGETLLAPTEVLHGLFASQLDEALLLNEGTSRVLGQSEPYQQAVTSHLQALAHGSAAQITEADFTRRTRRLHMLLCVLDDYETGQADAVA